MISELIHCSTASNLLRDCLTLSFVTHRHDLDGNPDGLISYCAVSVNVQTAADLLDSEDFSL